MHCRAVAALWRSAALGLILLACTPARWPDEDPQDRLAAELLDPRPAKGRQLSEDDLFPEAEIFARLRSAAMAEGRDLLAFASLRTGVHPYSGFAFLRSEQEIEVIETQLYWGRVRAKRLHRVTGETYDRFVASASAALDCTAGAAEGGASWGAALTYGEPETRESRCHGDWLTEETAGFAAALARLLAE
ncbi:MAG: hypothetical protein AAF657_01835 [Acidobacteriota bacterium]